MEQQLSEGQVEKVLIVLKIANEDPSRDREIIKYCYEINMYLFA